MQDFIKKLNSIDLGQLFKGKSSVNAPGADGQSGGASVMDELLFRIDKKLAVIVAAALFLIVLGLSSMFRTIEAFNMASELELKVGQMEAQKLKLEGEIASIKSANQELFALAKNAIPNQQELLKILTDAYAGAGMSIIKVSTGTPDKPDLIQISAEGNYRSLQLLLGELRQLSPSIDVKLVHIGIDPSKDLLQVSLGLRYVKAPKFAALVVDPSNVYAFMDGAKAPNQKSIQFFKTVQFVPQSPQAASAPLPPAVAGPATPASATVATNKSLPAKDVAPERNPFYTPPPAQTAGNPGSAAPGQTNPLLDLSRGPVTNAASSRAEGIYVTGCMVSPNKRACLFQLMDGSSAVYSVGAFLQKDMKILAITNDTVKVSSPNGARTIKVGEQVK